MARSPKYPGLQQKYEQALRDLLAGDEKSLSAREIVSSIRDGARAYGISRKECDDLDKNFANYTARAKATGVIVSGGPWGGFQLAASAAAGVSPSSEAGAGAKARPDEEKVSQQRRHWESLLHLPITVALSARFSARVLSMPNTTDSVRWGNPDMLMLRPSSLSRMQEQFDPGLDPDLFRLIDVTPECILTSIEVKGGLDRDRAKLFTAIAETAANSRWANEAWLVFVDRTRADGALADDVISLARSVEVGLIEIQIQEEVLLPVVHYAAPTRTTLRFEELTNDRVGVLRGAQSLLKEWERGDATFLDVELADQKARVLVQQALANLRTQKGFVTSSPLSTLLQPLRTQDDHYVTLALQASLRSAAIESGVDTDADLTTVIAEAADSTVVKKDADALRLDLRVFGETHLSRRA